MTPKVDVTQHDRVTSVLVHPAGEPLTWSARELTDGTVSLTVTTPKVPAGHYLG